MTGITHVLRCAPSVRFGGEPDDRDCRSTGVHLSMQLSDRIRFARHQRELSQAQVAGALAVHRSAVGHWERGQGCTPSSRNLLALAVLFAVRHEWLAHGEQPMHPTEPGTAADSAPLSDDEKRLLRAWREMPARKRGALLDLLNQPPPPACVIA